MFFLSKNCSISRTYVVSLVVEEYLFLLSFSIVFRLSLNKLFEMWKMKNQFFKKILLKRFQVIVRIFLCQ